MHFSITKDAAVALLGLASQINSVLSGNGIPGLPITAWIGVQINSVYCVALKMRRIYITRRLNERLPQRRLAMNGVDYYD